MTMVGDMVLETTQSTGLGDLILDGVPDLKHRSFASAFADGDAVYYAVSQQGGGFEVGLGTYSATGGDRLIRTTVYSSSNSDAPVDWGAGRKVVYTAFPAARLNERARVVQVVDVRTSPPVSPTTGDTYLVNSPASGGWAGHDWEWATWNGSAWAYEVAEAGEITFDLGSGSLWVKTISIQARQAQSEPGATGLFGSGSIPATAWDNNGATGIRSSDLSVLVFGVGFPTNIQLPDPDTVGIGRRISIRNKVGANLTISAAVGLVDESASYILSDNAFVTFVIMADAQPATGYWRIG